MKNNVMPVDVDKYLARIKFRGPAQVSLESLFQLQQSHLLTVPFENLDIHLGKKIFPENNFEKIVARNRGGFCYELNGLFHDLLQTLGYQVTLASARVYSAEKGYGPEFDHMVILVSVDDQKFLVDVGFGEFAFSPLPMILDEVWHDRRGDFVISAYGENDYVVTRISEGKFIPQYAFSETVRTPGDFAGMCLYHQTSPASHFTQKRLCSLPTGEGRITLTGNTLRITSAEGVTEINLASEKEVGEALQQYFSIIL
jgi:N-hydroxyarylamine O-acetyltransferase